MHRKGYNYFTSHIISDFESLTKLMGPHKSTLAAGVCSSQYPLSRQVVCYVRPVVGNLLLADLFG